MHAHIWDLSFQEWQSRASTKIHSVRSAWSTQRPPMAIRRRELWLLDPAGCWCLWLQLRYSHPSVELRRIDPSGNTWRASPESEMPVVSVTRTLIINCACTTGGQSIQTNLKVTSSEFKDRSNFNDHTESTCLPVTMRAVLGFPWNPIIPLPKCNMNGVFRYSAYSNQRLSTYPMFTTGSNAVRMPQLCKSHDPLL